MEQCKHIVGDAKICSGCTACREVCKKGAISFSFDKKGFKIPKVDSSICIECGLCRNVCPAINYKKSERENLFYGGGIMTGLFLKILRAAGHSLLLPVIS